MNFLRRVEEANNNTKPHAVCVPLPAQGHISPMLNLAKLLHSKGFYITFVNTDFNHRRFLTSRRPDSLDALPASFRFEAIPDGLPPASDPDSTQDPHSIAHAVLYNCHEPFKKLLLRLNNDPTTSSGSPPATFIVSDCVMPFTLDVASEIGGLPVLLYWTASACGFLAYAQYQPLLDKGFVPFKDPNYLSNGCLDMVVDWVPSMKGLRLKDIPTFIRTMDKDDILLKFMLISIEKSCNSSAPIIFNTFDTLEHDILKDVSKIIGPIYTIGPLHLYLQDYNNNNNEEEDDETIEVMSLGSNLWKEDSQCLEWLDSMKQNSVVYVSFGSITTMTKDNFFEFAWGLANSNHPFLWVIRPDSVKGDSVFFPSDFVEKTKDRSMVVIGATQDNEALAHFVNYIGAYNQS